MKDERVQAEEIALGVVVRGGRVLVQRREGDAGLGEVWEFPGGRIAPGESRAAAVAREVVEETGLDVRVGELLSAHCHAYPDRRVALYAYLCVTGAELATAPVADPDRVRWVTPGECEALVMPDANPPILAALQRMRGWYEGELHRP